MPHHPGDALDAGASAKVPIIVGWTRDEMSMFRAMEGARDVDEAGVRKRLDPVLGNRVDDALRAAQRVRPGATPTQQLVIVQSQGVFGNDSLELAERKQAAGAAPVYVYELTWTSPIEGGRLGAAHGMCVPLTMDNAGRAPYSDSSRGHALAAKMSEAWLAFARSGDPNHASLPHWPQYGDQRAVMLFDDECSVANDPVADLRAATVNAGLGLR